MRLDADMEDDAPDEEDALDFRQALNIFLRRRWIIFAVTCMTSVSVWLYVSRLPLIFESRALLVIEKERSGNAMDSPGPLVESNQTDYYQTQYRLITSESVLQQAYESMGEEGKREFGPTEGAARLARFVTVTPLPRSRLVHIIGESTRPELAARIANAVSESFVAQNLENQLFISKEVLQILQQKGSGPQIQRMYDSLPTVVTNGLLQGLKKEHSDTEAEIADLSKRYTPRHPVMRSLLSKEQTLAGQIRDETDKAVQSVKIQLSGQLKGNNVRIVDRAKVPKHPARPKKTRDNTLGFLFGLLLGLALAYLVDVLDQSVRNQEDVERKLRIPFLGQVPLTKNEKADKVFAPLIAAEFSVSSESLRNLRTMIEFAKVGDEDKQFLVTSAVQEEGKSFIASNLAVSFSQLGEKILIIDGDMRRPTLHKNFRLSSRTGISDFLAKGQDVEELDRLIQKTEIPNLSLLACGMRPPNPSELLNTPRVGALLDWARRSFDRVIIDCPPLVPIHDTLLWGRHVRSAAMVVRFGRTRAPVVALCRKRMQAAGMKTLGVIVNAATKAGLAYAGYGYYGYYDYRETYSSYLPKHEAPAKS